MKQSKFKDTVYHDENPETWFHSIPGGLTISAAIIILATLIFTAFYLTSPSTRLTDSLVIHVTVHTISLIISAGILLLSMVIAAKILSGIYFGYLGPALWKSLLVILIYSTLIHFVSNYGFLSLILHFVILIICFITIFRIDKFEASILALVNFILLMILNTALLALFR